MILTVGDWTFDADVPGTMAYSAGVWNNHCTCGYCRNFYETLNSAYPQIGVFLSQFGMNPLTPEEMMPFEPTLCTVSYCISGRVLRQGRSIIDIGGVTFTVGQPEDFDFDTACSWPYFVLTSGFLELPWVLDEDMDEVISPANEPEYLQKMSERLLQSMDSESILS